MKRIQNRPRLISEMIEENLNVDDVPDEIYTIECIEANACVNNKNKTQYIRLGEVINATNEQDGQKMYLYTNGVDFFVRELEEFGIKFTHKDRD